MKKIFILLALIIVHKTYAQSEKKLQQYAATITPNDLKTKLSEIAGAEMEGRETASEGQRIAAAYIENHFKKIGLLSPALFGHQMYFSIYKDSLADASLNAGGKSFKINEEFLVADLVSKTFKWKDDSIVFAGFAVPDSIHADYKNLRVKNKWVLFAEGYEKDAEDPEGEGRTTLTDKIVSSHKLLQLKNDSVCGIFIVVKDFPFSEPNPQVKRYIQSNDEANIPIFLISPAVAFAMLSIKFETFPDLKKIQPGIYKTSFECSMHISSDTSQSSNVIGFLPGTDKKDEYVFITAHYDHLGKKDSLIYYGADDNGSGTTGVLELAEIFSKMMHKGFLPRRSIVFTTFSGEEQGLWGSEYFIGNPVFPMNKISVDLNMDMIGRIDFLYNNADSDNYIYTIGEDRISSNLIVISDSVNNRFTNLKLDRKFNNPNDNNQWYYRSDHYNFASKGVPVIFYFDNMYSDYHKPTDTIDKINFELMAKRLKLVFFTAWAIANRSNMLIRDIPLK